MSSSSLVSLPPPNVSIAPHPRLSQAHLASFSFIFFFMHNTSHVHPGGSYLRTNQTFITTLSTASLTRPGGPHHIPLPNSYRSCSASIAAEDLQRIELFFFFFLPSPHTATLVFSFASCTIHTRYLKLSPIGEGNRNNTEDLPNH